MLSKVMNCAGLGNRFRQSNAVADVEILVNGRIAMVCIHDANRTGRGRCQILRGGGADRSTAIAWIDARKQYRSRSIRNAEQTLNQSRDFFLTDYAGTNPVYGHGTHSGPALHFDILQ